MYWIASERDWATPLEVFPDENNVFVHVKIASVPIVKRQRLVTSQFLDQVAYKKDGDIWIIPKEAFAKVANPAGLDEDPEDVVRWNPLGYAWDEQYKNELKLNQDYFYDELVTAGLARSRDSAKYLWQRICHFMLRWLLEGNRLDMEFAMLDLLPYRVNFLEAMRIMHYNRMKQKYHFQSYGNQKRTLAHIFRYLLLHENLFAYDGASGTVSWNLFILPRPLFKRMLQQREMKRKSRPYYFSQVVDTLKGRYEQIMAFYFRYWYAARLPKLQVCYVPDEKRVRGVSQPDCVVSAEDLEIPVIPVSSLTLVKRKSDCAQADPVQEVNGVPSLPDIQQSAQDLWNNRKIYPRKERTQYFANIPGQPTPEVLAGKT